MFYWFYDYVTYDYYNGPLSMSWEDESGQYWFAYSVRDIYTHVCWSITEEDLRAVCNLRMPLRDFCSRSVSGKAYLVTQIPGSSAYHVESVPVGDASYQDDLPAAGLYAQGWDDPDYSEVPS
jgi:hypothetical protein